MDTDNMQRVSLYLPRDLVKRADQLKQKYGCSSRNEFYAKALERFIADDLLSGEDVTSKAVCDRLAEAVHALSEDNAKAISKGLYRYAVQLEMLMRIIARLSDVEDAELEEMRREAINNVRRTRGKVRLEEIMQGYYNEE